MSRKFRVILFRPPPAEPETIEFVFAAAAKEYAKTEVEAGRSEKAEVYDPDWVLIRTFPR